ncbi:MAG: hypothetical protein LUE92_17780 [Clostridiales bacterium]|nr:hypothetical protein [Clostridiales bacterium]
MGQRKAELIWLCLPPFHLIHPILSSISCHEYMGFIFGGSDGKVEIQYEAPDIEKFGCIITCGRLIIKPIRNLWLMRLSMAWEHLNMMAAGEDYKTALEKQQPEICHMVIEGLE